MAHILLDVVTPLQHRVVLDGGRWKVVVGKHPHMEKRLGDVEAALRYPDVVRGSHYDGESFLYYQRSAGESFMCVVICQKPGQHAFITTAYRSCRVKAGPILYQLGDN